jgi:hypothetical protein
MTSADPSIPAAPWRLLDKLVLLAALAVAVALFLSVGWMAIEPVDPRGPVSLITHRSGTLMVLQTAALAAVTAALATVMIGPKLADVGVFAAAMGMAVVSIRGANASYLLLDVAEEGGGGMRILAGKLLVESLIWGLVLAATVIVSGLVMRWFLNLGRFGWLDEDDAVRPRRVTLDDLALAETPLLWRWLKIDRPAGRFVVGEGGIPEILKWIVELGPPKEYATEPGSLSRVVYAPGVLSLLTTLLVAGVVYPVFSSGYFHRTIDHGQVCFAVFTAFYCGVWASKRLYPARTALWSLLAVPILLVAGYAWVMAGAASPAASVPNIPDSDFLRALPLTFVSVGALGVLTGHWWIEPSAAPVKKAQREQPRRQAGRRAR